jgi:hypothetical protein
MSKCDQTLRCLAPRAGAVAALTTVAKSALVMSALALTVAACTGSGTPKAATSRTTPARPVPGATFRGTIYVSTATSHFIRTFTERVANVANCAAAARTGEPRGTFRVPSPTSADLEVNIQVAAFHGPGTYTPRMLKHDLGDSILLTGKAGTGQYVLTSATASATHGKEALFLQKDGSGQLVYSGAHLDGRARKPALAGLIEWSCTS